MESTRTPPPRRRSRAWRWLRTGAIIVVLLLVLVCVGGWLLLRASLPSLTGDLALPGLHAPVTVERDADGVPTIHADDREDAMRALGYLHGQDRFFQMDLLRRRGAGELSELFGVAALKADQEARRHRFRRQARTIIATLSPDKRRLLEAYAQGANAGLASLWTRPWEYLLLRATPRPWQPEDTQLVADAMVMSLEDRGGGERTRLALADVYGEEVTSFLQPLVVEASAALDGSSAPAPPVPPAEAMRPRTSDKPAPAVSQAGSSRPAG